MWSQFIDRKIRIDRYISTSIEGAGRDVCMIVKQGFVDGLSEKVTGEEARGG